MAWDQGVETRQDVNEYGFVLMERVQSPGDGMYMRRN